MIELCSSKSLILMKEDVMEGRVESRNNHILINQLHYCRFIYYMVRNLSLMPVAPNTRTKVGLILYKHLQKLIKQLADEKKNWLGLAKWENFKQGKKYKNTLLTMK